MNKYDTIILGAGISGIGCANQLLKNGFKDFKIISPDIGGRILESGDDEVEYGAYYIMSIYHHVSVFMEKKERIKISDLVFHKDNKKYKFFNKKIILHLLQLIKLIFILLKFQKHYKKFKKNCEFKPQVNCLKEDKYLWNLYNTKTEEFIIKNKLQDIFYNYMVEVLHGSSFVPVKKLNAFTTLHFSLPLIFSVYEFNFKEDEVELLLKDNFINDIVVNFSEEGGGYKILTKKGDSYYCKKLVSALPPHIAKDLIKFKDDLREPVSVYMFHLQGDLKDDWSEGEDNLFADDNRMLALSLQTDGSYLFYSKDKNPDINKYFNNYLIIKQKFWDPAFNIGGSNLVNFEQGKNLYVIGDNNVCGLEDSYIYGIYAGNKILGRTKD